MYFTRKEQLDQHLKRLVEVFGLSAKVLACHRNTQKHVLAPFSEMFNDLHSNDLCKSEDFTAFGTLRCVQSVCALDNVCSGKQIASNWAIYYRHPPAVFLLDPGACLQYFSPIGGDIEQCGLVTVSQAGEKCEGTFFQYSSSNGDCGCSTDDCAKSSAYDAWDIFHFLNFQPASTSGQGNYRFLLLFALPLLWP